LKIFIDSNLLIYLNALKSFDLRKNYEDFYINILSNYEAYLDVLVLDKLIYISKKRYNVPYEISIKFLESIVLPLRKMEYKKAFEIIKISKVKPSNALHIATMIINNITKIASEDKELDNIEGIERIWLK